MTPDASQLAHLRDLPFSVEAMINGPTLQVREVLTWSVGTLIETNRPAGETVQILAGGAAVGSGELSDLNGETIVRMVKFKSASK